MRLGFRGENLWERFDQPLNRGHSNRGGRVGKDALTICVVDKPEITWGTTRPLGLSPVDGDRPTVPATLDGPRPKVRRARDIPTLVDLMRSLLAHRSEPREM